MSNPPQVELDYQADLEIDQHNLELEWLGQAGKIMRYSELLAQAIYDRNRAKEALDVTKANLDASVRAAAAGEKVTEAVVSNRITATPSHIEAVQTLHQAEYVVSLLQGAVAAFQARKSALENLVRLFGMKYYAEPFEEAGSEVKPMALQQGRLKATEALKKPMAVARPAPEAPQPQAAVNAGPPRPPMRPLPRKG